MSVVESIKNFEMLGVGNMLRSAEMEYVSISMQEHIAHDVLQKLGEVGTVQFADLNGDMTAFKRYYTPWVRRCDDLEKKLRFFEDECKKHAIEPEVYSDTEFNHWVDAQRQMLAREHRGTSLLDFWESIINDRHRDYSALKQERDRTAAQLYQAVQRRHVIEKAAGFFLSQQAVQAALSSTSATGSAPAQYRDAEAGTASRSGDGEDEMTFRHIAGIIDTEDKVRFARIIFRASSGHAVVRFSDITDPLVDEKGAKHTKSVFAIFFRGRTLTGKVDRICTAFNAHQHDIPPFENAAAVQAALHETKQVITDSVAWVQTENLSSTASLRHIALLLRKWGTGIQCEKATYHALNCFLRSPERGTVTGQAWVLATSLQQVQSVIREAHALAAQGGRVMPHYFNVLTGPNLPTAPTHFHTNKVTAVFQGIVNTYGVPRYGEANPALFSVITFPFLFGVMYGDIGHAIILTLFSAYLVYKEDVFGKKPLGEMFAMCFKGRYMLLMMGFFSIYCGLVYNDFFSLATSSFGGTRWTFANYNGTFATEASKPQGYGDVYPFGVDPLWHISSNDLLFFNSLKMKMSVIFGITQMTFGLFLRLSNAIHFKSKIDLWFEAVPQIIFMVSLFGYMVFLILLKWFIDWNNPATRPGAPPSLIDTLINVVLKPGKVNDPMFSGQAGFQVFILLVVFFCVPVMLLGKPIALKMAHAREQKLKGLDKDNGHHGNEKVSLLAADGGAPVSATGALVASDVSVHVTAGNVMNRNGAADNSNSAPGLEVSNIADLAVTQPIIPASAAAAGGHGHGHGDHFAFGEIMVHSAIETIEFVLGSVSNTASYLRLWALSLAHSQLATVFYERAIVSTVASNNFIMVFIGWSVWAGITSSVLLVMDVLECFLHALRLHWVEFQNKFYKADGVKFTPFSFAALKQAAAAAAQ